jgi:hypothetical protein
MDPFMVRYTTAAHFGCRAIQGPRCRTHHGPRPSILRSGAMVSDLIRLRNSTYEVTQFARLMSVRN